MDSEQFNSPPTTTAALTSYFRRYGGTSSATDIDLIHFQHAADIEPWLGKWQRQELLWEGYKDLE